MSYSVRNCARNLLQAFPHIPHSSQYVPPLQQPCWAHVGPREEVSTPSPRGCTWRLLFVVSGRADSDLLTTTTAGGSCTPAPLPGSRHLSALQISFPVVPPSHGLPFLVVKPSSPPCLGGTTLLYILHPFYTVLLEIKPLLQLLNVAFDT